MTPEEKKRFEDLENRVSELSELFNDGRFPDRKISKEKIVSQDQMIAEGNGIKITSYDNPVGVQIRTGSAINDAGIKAEVGTLPNGSIYLSTSSTQPMFVMVGTTWTLLNIP